LGASGSKTNQRLCYILSSPSLRNLGELNKTEHRMSALLDRFHQPAFSLQVSLKCASIGRVKVTALRQSTLFTAILRGTLLFSFELQK
jgi:hypothetical protein